MGEKGFSVLQESLKKTTLCNIKYIVSAKDKNVKKDFFDEIRDTTINNNILFFERDVDHIPDLNIDYYFAISWRWLIKSSLDKLIVFHDSLLPKYRGFNPLVTALIQGDSKIGVTAIFASESFDTGDIIEVESFDVDYPLKIQKAISIISKLYGKLYGSVIDKIISGKLFAVKQNESFATYSLWRDESDYVIDWNQSSDKIKRFIDSVGYPYNGAKTTIDGVELTVLDAEVYDKLEIINNVPGKIFFIQNKHPVIACGEGLLKLTDVVFRDTGLRYFFNKTRIRLI